MVTSVSKRVNASAPRGVLACVSLHRDRSAS